MQPISRILVPVDFSDRSLEILPYVKTFARHHNSEIILLHVVDPVYVVPETGISAPAIIPMPQWLFEQKAGQLETFAAAELAGLLVRRLIFEGDPETQIAAAAKSEDVGVVAMPTHGRGLFRRFLIGSVTAKVLHDVACPVLTGTHAQERAHANQTDIKRIACAIDLSSYNDAVISAALSLAASFGAKVGIVHVVPRWAPDQRAALSSDLSDQLKELVRGEIARLDGAPLGAEPDISIEEGGITDGVCRFTRSCDADLLIIGRGSHTERLRTNTYAIIRQSPCPVLSI